LVEGKMSLLTDLEECVDPTPQPPKPGQKKTRRQKIRGQICRVVRSVSDSPPASAEEKKE